MMRSVFPQGAWHLEIKVLKDFSSLFRFNRSSHKVDFSRFLKYFWSTFITCFVLWYYL